MAVLVALQIDFQRRRGLARARLGWLLLFLGALALGGAGVEYASVEGELASTKARAGQERHRASGNAQSEPEDAAYAEPMKAAQGVAAQLATPWAALFAEIEAAAHEDVALLGLQAEPAAGTLRMNGEARNFPALMAYVRKLEASAVLAEVRLTGHAVRQQDPRRPVAFSLTASWKGAR